MAVCTKFILVAVQKGQLHRSVKLCLDSALCDEFCSYFLEYPLRLTIWQVVGFVVGRSDFDQPFYFYVGNRSHVILWCQYKFIVENPVRLEVKLYSTFQQNSTYLVIQASGRVQLYHIGIFDRKIVTTFLLKLESETADSAKTHLVRSLHEKSCD